MFHFATSDTYATLPDRFFTKIGPTPVRAPSLIAVNDDLARDLGLNPDDLTSPEGVAILAGNALPEGATPLAAVYAGHQFGGWNPRLGDGRAVLLGELTPPTGPQVDIQLKGSGRTPYSRGGDGRAWVGPVIREYLLSEAMHALGVPTTRALAAVLTGEDVYRETRLPGAVLTRVARSHIRIGTFQYFASQRDIDALRTLYEFTRARHYPEAETPLQMLEQVITAQAELVAQWMSLGFIHGVMNTDNMTLSGETIDYGPCAFMDAYHPAKVFSSIDRHGRYAYNQQADIAVWNLAQLASAILPLIDTDEAQAVELASAALNDFAPQFQAAWTRRFGRKIGLENATPEDANLIQDLLNRMGSLGADFTNTFRALAEGTARDAFSDPAAYDQWQGAWRARLAAEGTDAATQTAIMRAANPAIIPRNHRVEEAIAAAVAGDYAPFHRLHSALKSPYDPAQEMGDLTMAPTADQEVRQTFCGT